MKSKEKYDVTIVGAGLGGLSCGCYLAKAGLKILIIEKNIKAGGYCTYFERSGIKIDAGPHYIGSCSKRGILGMYFKELGLNNIITIKPRYLPKLIFPDDIFKIPNEYGEYLQFLKEKFPSERLKVDIFFNDLLKIRMHSYTSATIEKLKKISFSKYIDRYFKNAKIKSIISSKWWFLGLPPGKVSAYYMAVMLSSYLKDGLYFIEGGAHQITDMMINVFRRNKGKIVFKEEIKKIIIKNDKDLNITLYNGEMVQSKCIVSSIDIRYFFNNLISSKDIPQDYLKNINKIQSSTSAFNTTLVVSYKYMNRLKEIEGWYYSAYNHDIGAKDFYYISIPTLHDNSIAPRNLHLITIGHLDRKWFTSNSEWTKYKILAERINLNRIKTRIDDIDNYIISKESASPKTYEFYTSNYRGAIYGMELNCKQVRKNATLFNNGILKNIYFAGHWSSYGGGVMPTIISGRKVAQKIIANMEM